MISTVDDPDEVYRRLKWYTSSREAFEKTGKIPQSDRIVIPAKGKEGSDNYVPPVTERDLFQEFGDIITETVDPTTGQPVNLPTALASNSLGFMLLQEANIGKSSSPRMQRRMNQLGDKAESAHREFTEIMQNMIIAGFASEDKDMIGLAAKLASDIFALDMEDDVAILQGSKQPGNQYAKKSPNAMTSSTRKGANLANISNTVHGNAR